MSEVKIIMNDGTEHIVPEVNLPNVQKVSGHLIKKVVKLNNNVQTPQINRTALEGVVKRELKWNDAKIKKATDLELLDAIRTPKK
jgi:hypothetical protein